MQADLAIDVQGMTKRFGARTAVDGVSLQVKRGEICGFLGPNGSGKTTFIRMLCGLLSADEGSGTCLGYNVRTESDSIKREVGYLTQRFSYYEDLSILENLEFVARMYSVESRSEVVKATVERLGLEKRTRQLAGQLSGGWKQRLALAACMLHNPKLLLLDEPTAGVDPKARRDFWDEIHNLAAEGLTFLIATHYMDEAERCHKLAFISDGKLLTKGSCEQVLQEAGLKTWAISGENLVKLNHELQNKPGIEQVAAFGNTLHVSGPDRDLLKNSLQRLVGKDYQLQEIDSGLEDVFIHLMSKSQKRS